MNSTYSGITQILYLLPYCLVLHIIIPVLHGSKLHYELHRPGFVYECVFYISCP